MKFLDQAKIYLQSGHGGAGCVSFHREKFIEFGGPDGGNGGRGGHIIFRCVDDANTLIDFRYTQHFKAGAGHHGQGREKTGAKGDDLVVRIPVGTQILDEDKQTILLDFTTVGEEVVFLYGGDGGFGNAHYKSATNQAPRKSTPGFPGQERAVWLRLKLIADAGIIGLPNAGKSTFLSAVTQAKPKIADYPFTTLAPNLGVVKLDGAGTDFVLADIPGLIEGAHEGTGLGDRFLGHVERTAILLHLIDGTQDDVAEAYTVIRRELEQYGEGLADKPEIVAINKIDAIDRDTLAQKIKDLRTVCKTPIHTISAVAHDNTRDILFELLKYVDARRNGEKDTGSQASAFDSYDPLQ